MAVNTEILTYINAATGYETQVAENVIQAIVNFLAMKLRQDEEITIEGLGKYLPKPLALRKGRNPRTGEEIMLPPSKKVKFKASSKLLKAIQPTPSIAPEPSSAPAPSTEAPVSTAAPIAIAPASAIPSGIAPLHAPGTETSTRKMPPPPPPEMMVNSRTWFVAVGGDPNKLEEVVESELPKYAGRSTAVWSERTGWKLIADLPELAYLFSSAA